MTMKLRSHASTSFPSEGKEKIEYIESSNDEDEVELLLSDAEFLGSSDKDEEMLNVLDDNVVSGDGLETPIYFSDDDISLSTFPKRRKSNPVKSKGEQSNKMQGEFETETNNDPFDDVHQRIKSKRKGKNNKDKPVLLWEIMAEEHDRWIDENRSKLDCVNQNEMVAEITEASDDMIIPLLRYQKEWLAWALKQEESAVKGGILAGEMGMGKTLQAIALVLFKRKITKEIYWHELPSSSASSTTDLPSINGTLVICPVIAATQWAHYIKDRRSNMARAILSLQSSYKWALSGTPPQNRVGELYSLVRFLQLVPYSYYCCKDCDCRMLDYRTVGGSAEALRN